MRCLIRDVKRRRNGITHDDKHFEGEKLTIGRATDQSIFLSDLRVALHHATITATKRQRFEIQADSLSGISINNLPVKSKPIKVGDVITIANYQITVAAPSSGYDLALEVEALRPGEAEETPLAQRSCMSLAETGLKKRAWSWAFFSVLLVMFLVLPISGAYNESWRQTLRTVPPVSDASWDSGELANAHKLTNTNCNACHETPFRMVQDHACVTCHQEMLDHAAPDSHELTELSEARCASCHREHNAPHSLAIHDQSLCNDCHGDLSARVADTDLGNVSDFGKDHPEFRPTLITYIDGEERSERVLLDGNNKPKERSNLKFPHNEHLKAEGVKTPSDGKKVLQCSDCHRPDPSGLTMQPINMATMCQECHRLDFDKIDPERQVPHGDAVAVLENVKEFYHSVALQGGYLDDEAPEVVRKRRRPGKDSLSREEVKEAFDWAEKKWREAAAEMFEYRTCIICHDLNKTVEEPPEWRILPVRVADIWMPKAYFSHIKHATMECQDCHEAEASEESSDVLLPDLTSCRECHGGEYVSGDKVPSACVDCHRFHVAEGHIMGKDAVLATESGLTVLFKNFTGLASGDAPRNAPKAPDKENEQ